MDISQRAARLIQPDLPGNERLDEISDLRERIEMFHHPRDYAGFLEVLFPAFEKVLRGLVPPSFRSDDVNHKIRLKVIEVLHRLPVNDTLSKYASQLFKICLEIIRTDNEENAMLAVRIIFELERAIPQSLDRESPEFIDLVQQLYAGMETSIANAFTEASLESGADRTSSPDSDGPYTILPGIHSFRVVVECPLIVMLILNIMHNMNARLATLVPQLLKALSARMPSSVLQQNLEGKPARVRQFRFESMLMCQVKTLSFLTYVLISHTDLVVKHEAEMAYHVQNLLRIIPAECISVRRELLVATRHILSKNTSKGLFPYLNALLDESVLLGTPNGRMDLAVKPMPPVQNLPGPGAPQTQQLNSSAGGVQNRLPSRKQPLVNLAYAALTDLVMAMRGKMDVSQLSRVVYLYTRNIHDASLPVSTQITSARVLLNLVDGIYHQRDSSQQHSSGAVQGVREFGAHGLLIKILDALARKLSTLRYLMKRIAIMERLSANQGNVPKTVDEVAIPMESFLLVRPVAPPSGGADTGGTSSSDTPPPAVPLERTLSMASAAVEQGGGEVVKVELFPGGQNGMRRKRPTMPSGVDLGEHRELDRAFVLGIAAPFESSAYQHDTTAAPPDTMRDVCHLIRTIIWGLRTVLYCITNIDASANPSVTGASPGSAASKASQQPPATPSQNPAATPPAKALGEEDLKLISKTFAWGIQCLSAYDPRVNPDRPPADLDSDETEVIELMSNAFAVLDATTFTDVMQENIRLFYTCMLKHRKIARIATNFLRSSTLSRSFASVLIPFLLSRYSLIGGRAGPMYSSIEAYVDSLMAGKLGEAEENDNEKIWPYISSPPHATSPARQFEATFFGGSTAQSLKQPKPVSSTSGSVPETTNFGLVVDEKALLDAVFSDTEEFSADEEAYLLFKLHKATFQSLQQSVRQLTNPLAQQTCLYGLTSLLAAYLEPTAIACLSAAADTMAFPLESLRRPRTDATPPSKIDFDDVAENAISCLRTMLAVAVEGVQDMREVIRSTVQRVAKAIARAANRLLIVAIQDPTNYVAMNRADAIAELCLVISFALLDDANLLALPFSHALSAGIRGNDMLVTKALGALERLIQLNGFDRVCVARGGLVAKALRYLVKHAPTHSSTALKLQGRSAYETPAQYFFPDSPEEHKTFEIKLKVPWKGAQALADLDLTQTAKAVCAYLEDVFTAPKLITVVGSAKVELSEQDLTEIHQKREAVDLIMSILKLATASSGMDPARDRELLTTMFTCVADAFIGDHSWTLLQDQVALRPVAMGEAMTKAFVRGCPHRARAAERLLITVGATTSGPMFSVLKEGLLPTLLESLKEKTWYNRTGGLWALSILLKTEAGKALAIDFEKPIVQSVCLALVDHQVELGSDALFHAGNAMFSLLEAMNHMLQPGTIDILLEALRAENPRARRILRGSIVASIQRRRADNREEFARSARALIERSQANPLTRTEMSSLSVLAARLECYLFVLEEVDEISPFALKSARELATDLLARLPILLADDPDSLHTDPEAFSFTFMPTTAVFRTAFFRLARRICEKAAAEQDIEQIDPMALIKAAIGAINSVWPMVSRAAELLIRTLSGIEGYSSTVETLVREQVDKFLDNPGRAVSYTISAIRGLDRMLAQTIPKLPSVVPSTFAQGVLTALAERCDPTKVFSSLTDKHQPGEEVYAAGALLDLLGKMPQENYASFVELAIINMAKFDNQMHLFHYSNFPAVPLMNISTGKPVNFKLQIGSNCGARLSSPLRPAIARFFAVSPKLVLEHIFSADRLIKRTYSSLVCELLKRKVEGEALRQELLTNPKALKEMTAATFDVTYEPPADASSESQSRNQEPALRRAQARVVELRFQGVRLVRSIIKWAPEILRESPDLMTKVLAVMKAPDREVKMAAEEKLPLRHRTLSRIACKSVIAGFKAGAPVAPLCEILPVTLVRSTTDTLFLSDFFSKSLRSLRGQTRNEVINTFTKLLMDPQTSIALKEAVLRVVLVPLLSTSFIQRAVFAQLQKNNASPEAFASFGLNPKDSSVMIFPGEAIRSLIGLVLTDRMVDRQMAPEYFGPASIGEDFEVQVLQLSTLLIAHSGKDLMEHRKSLIRLAWNHLSGEDTPAKHWAYINICTFIDVYHTPPDIILQVYVELLRAHTTEARELVTRALDLLAPALHKRMEVSKYIKAIKWTKKLLFDDGHHLPQLTHVFQMVTHHPYMFYQYRAQFVPHMVMALSKVALPPNTPIENRELAVNVVELVLGWERTRELEESKNAAEANANGASPREETTRAYRLVHSLFSIIANFLLKVTLQLVEARDARSKLLCRRCILLVRSCLNIAKRRSDKPLQLVYGIFAKPIHTQAKKQEQQCEQDLAQVKKILSETGAGGPSEHRSLPVPPWERRVEPGLMSCILELLTHIVAVDGDIVAKPFLEKHALDLHTMIDPMLGCFEKDANHQMAKFIFKLVQTIPLASEKPSFLHEVQDPSFKREQSNEERSGLFAGAVSHAPPPPSAGKAFYPAFQAALHRRLVQAADDPKKLEAANVASLGSGVGGNSARTTSTTRHPNQYTMPTPDRGIPKIIQQRIAREVTSRQLEYQSAGPRGVLNILRLLQVLCGSNDPPPYPFDSEIQPTQVASAGVADRFSSILMKLVVKTTKDLFSTTSAVSGSRAAAGQPGVAGANRIDMGDDIPTLQRNKGLIAQTIDISLALLSTATLNQEMRKSFMQILASLLDKLDISEQLVLRRVVKVVGQWFFAKLLGPRERSAFWTKLSNLEQRAAGLPETTRLVEDIHELALSFPPAHPRTPLIVGILSPSPKQRAKFWSMNFTGSVGNAPEFLGDLFAGRREDLLTMGTRFWLPLVLRFLLESRLMTVHDTDLFHLLSRVAFADGSGVVASKAWRDVLASAWSVATDMERKSLTDSLAGLAIAAPMSTMSYMAVRTGFEQRRTAFLMSAPPAGTIRLANIMRKLDRSFLLSKLAVIRELVESVWLVGGTSYMEPQTIRFLGNLAAGDKFATSIALEERLNLQETNSVEALLIQNSEMGDDDLVRGLLISANLGDVLEKGITLELGNHWQKAMNVYLEYLSKQSLVGERDRIKLMTNKLNTASSMRALKRLKQDWDDDASTDEGDTDLNDDGENELELIMNQRSNATQGLSGGQARLLARGLDLRMRKCAASLGQWKTLLHWGEHERDQRLVVEALGRRPDLLTKPILEEVRRCLPVLPSPAASLDHACLEVCMAMHNGLKPGQEMEDLLKKAYRTALLLHPCPSKGVSQRLVELEESVQYSYRLQKALPEVRPSLLNNLLTAWTQRPPTGTLSPEEYAAIASWRLEYVRLSGAFGASTELDNNCALVLLQGARHARLKGLLELAGMYIEQALTLFPTNKSLIAFELVNERSRVALAPSNVPYETLCRVYEDLEGIRKVCERKDVLSEANRMRGKVFAQAGKDPSLVDEAFAQAVTSEANSSRAWLDWARAIANRSKPDAAACAARALALGLSSARLLVPLLLEPEGGAIGLVESISPSIFISWISTLLAHPCPFSKAVLERLVVSEPQAMLHELTCIRPQQLGGTPRQCIESIRKNHAEVFQEFTKMKELLTSSTSQISDWRPRSLRIPGTRRKLDCIVIAKEPCGRRGAKRRADMFSDDGRAPVRFAIHETTLDESKKRMITLIYVAYDLLIQDGGLSEYFVSPAIFHVDDAAFLEKDAEVTSLSYIVQSELKWFENGAPPPTSLSKDVTSKALRQWFFRQFADYDSLLNGRRRFAKQLAAHSLVTSLCPGVLVGSPNEILVGRGFESTFIVAGVDTGPEDAPSSPVPFRLTPNLQTLLTTPGVYGPFASGLAGVARCLAKGDARHTLGLLMGDSELERHEILSDKDDVKDVKVMSMIREALGFASDADVNANAKWMPWC